MKSISRPGTGQCWQAGENIDDQWPGTSSTLMVEAAGIEPASESLRQRRLHAYPGCGGNPRPEAPFPASAPRRINPANRAVGPIPESHRRLGRTAGQARLVDVLSRPAGVVRKDVAYAASARSVLAFVVFPPFTGDGPPTCSRCFMYLRRTQYAPSSREVRRQFRGRKPAPDPGGDSCPALRTASRIGYDCSSL